MKVERVLESPRVTKPYTDAQWRAILAAGHRVDQALAEGHVRLTMGGEPTFVSADDMDGAEWTVDALGPTKRTYAGKLLRRLLPLWSPGAAITHALGKHYPGEQLPRWALNAHWRRDGEPVWRDLGLLAADEDTGSATAESARAFCEALAERLQVAPDLINPAYEGHPLLPVEGEPPARQCAGRGLQADGPAGARAHGTGVWARAELDRRQRAAIAAGGAKWRPALAIRQMVFQAGGCCSSFPATHRSDSGCHWKACLGRIRRGSSSTSRSIRSQPRDRLPPRQDYRRIGHAPAFGIGPSHGYYGDMAHAPGLVAQRLPEIGREEPGLVRTAMAVEARGGKIHVFFPAALCRRGLARSGGRRRGHGGGIRHPGGARRLPAAARSAAEPVLRHAGPGGDRGEHPPRPRISPKSSSAPRSFTKWRERPGWRRRNSCSTASMSAPAAATMW